ncbi:MAG: sensor histidine kinase, partial [Cyanobacteria bacterium P01_A01_bin.135]
RQREAALTQEVEILAADLERTRIARDIHDSLGHTLMSLDVQLELAQQLYGKSDQGRQALSTSKMLASQAVKEVRRAVATIRDEAFDLNAALTQLIEQFRSSAAISVESQLNLPHLPLHINHQIFCIVKEGLENVRRHSQARSVRVEAYISDDGLSLSLIDDGAGFDPALPYSGFGLRGMQERVQLAGGWMSIKSTPGQGTALRITVPGCCGRQPAGLALPARLPVRR